MRLTTEQIDEAFRRLESGRGLGMALCGKPAESQIKDGQFRSHVEDQVWAQMTCELWDRLRDHVMRETKNKVYAQLCGPVQHTLAF